MPTCMHTSKMGVTPNLVVAQKWNFEVGILQCAELFPEGLAHHNRIHDSAPPEV